MTAAPDTETRVIVALKNGRKFRVAPSRFGGHSVVEILASGNERPERNLRVRNAAINLYMHQLARSTS